MIQNTTLARALTVVAIVAAIIFISAGRWDLPFVWAILCVLCVGVLARRATDLGIRGDIHPSNDP